MLSGDCSLSDYIGDFSSKYAEAILDHVTNDDYIRRNIQTVIGQQDEQNPTTAKEKKLKYFDYSSSG